MPHSGNWVAHLVTHEPDTIVTRIGLDLVHCRASPSHDGRLFSHGGAGATKSKGLVDSGNVVSAVRRVVVHVALARMTLTPTVFVWDDVFRLGKVRRSQV